MKQNLLTKLIRNARSLLCVALVQILACTVVLAQANITVSGTVTSSDDGAGIPGVNVLVKGTTVGTVTDIDGAYSLQVPDQNAVLVFSFIGYTSTEVQVGSRSVIDLVLDRDVTTLDEVVVVGYGEQSRRHLTGAIQSVSAQQFENERPQNISDILRSNAAGLAVGVSSSAKGAGLSDFEVRGDNSLRTSSEPLIVLDGVIYLGDMSDINPNDVESIDVMKDASSAAIYGARSANGVIQVTTKKGAVSDKPVININSSVGFSEPKGYAEVRGPHDFVNWRSGLMKSLNYHNPATMDKLYLFDNPDNLPAGVTLDQWREGLGGEPVEIWLSRLGLRPLEIENYKAGKSIDWADQIYRTALRQDHNFSISGRTNTLRYFVSLGYNNNEGVLEGDQFKTIRNRVNIDANVTDWLNIGVNSQFARRDESNVNVGTNIQSISPWGSMYEDDGKTLRISPVDDLVATRNPLYDRAFTDRLHDFTTINATLFAHIKLPFGITYRANYTPYFENERYYNHKMSQHQEWGLLGGEVSRAHRERFAWQLDNIFKWEKEFGDHRLDATVLINAEKVQSWSDSLSVQGFAPSDVLGYHNVRSGSSESRYVNSNDTYATRDALMGRLNYSFRDRYMATVALRRDGYSAFGSLNPHAYFPSASLGWVFSEESFAENNFLTYGKLRVSWGENGNSAIGIYDALSPLGVDQYPYYSLTSGTPYEVNRMFITRMANLNLRWERTRQVNVGLDFTILKGLVDGIIDVYKSSTLDLLVDRSLPLVNAYRNVTDNLGEIENKGLEITLNAALLKRPKVEWNSSFNFTLNRNKIVSLYGNMEDVLDDNGNVIGQRESDDIQNRWFIGHAIDEIWGPRVLGVWQLGEETSAAVYGQFPGDFKLKDVNEDGIINQDDYEFQGNRQPQYRFNLRQDIRFFKSLDFSFNIYAQLGYKEDFNIAKNSNGFPERQNSYLTDYWTPENPINNYSRLFALTGGVPFDVFRSKSFLRLDRVSLSYAIPQKFISKVAIQNLRVFGNIQNVAVWAPEWELTDPQTEALYPRTYTLGLSLTL